MHYSVICGAVYAGDATSRGGFASGRNRPRKGRVGLCTRETIHPLAETRPSNRFDGEKMTRKGYISRVYFSAPRECRGVYLLRFGAATRYEAIYSSLSAIYTSYHVVFTGFLPNCVYPQSPLDIFRVDYIPHTRHTRMLTLGTDTLP